MRKLWLCGVFMGSVTCASQPVLACMAEAPLVLDDVRFADVVVIGRISNYKRILDEEFRQSHKYLPREGSYMTDYARFDVLVDEVLKGKAASRITVTWDNSTFAEPQSMLPGTYLLALRRPSSDLPPLRGPSVTLTPNREPDALTVLQAPCAPAFILDSKAAEAVAVRKILAPSK